MLLVLQLTAFDFPYSFRTFTECLLFTGSFFLMRFSVMLFLQRINNITDLLAHFTCLIPWCFCQRNVLIWTKPHIQTLGNGFTHFVNPSPHRNTKHPGTGAPAIRRYNPSTPPTAWRPSALSLETANADSYLAFFGIITTSL